MTQNQKRITEKSFGLEQVATTAAATITAIVLAPKAGEVIGNAARYVVGKIVKK